MFGAAQRHGEVAGGRRGSGAEHGTTERHIAIVDDLPEDEPPPSGGDRERRGAEKTQDAWERHETARFWILGASAGSRPSSPAISRRRLMMAGSSRRRG